MKHLLGATLGKTVLGVGTAQTQSADARQRPNDAGGYTFAVDPWVALDRFLILGSEGGTYYATEQKHTERNIALLNTLINLDGKRVVDRIRLLSVGGLSVGGRAPKQSTLIFALAACAGLGDKETRAYALTHLNAVCRTGSTLLEFAAYLEGNKFRGWGRSLRRAINTWYESKDARDLAYQVTKYQNRNGFTHNDLLRLAHVGGKDYSGQHRVTYDYIKGKGGSQGESEARALFDAIAMLPTLPKEKRAGFIVEHRLVREVLPTEWLADANVWAALLHDMPIGAMVRNLGKMTAVGLLTPGSDGTTAVMAALSDPQRIMKGRVHPIAILGAAGVYAQGHGERGSLSWMPVPKISEALDEAFYLAFPNVEPTGKRLCIGIDWSGSMETAINGMPGLTARHVAAALALVHAWTEPDVKLLGFTTSIHDAPFTKGHRLADVKNYIDRHAKGEGTDCAQPILWAAAKGWQVDAFILITDNETWAGKMHVHEALRRFRKETVNDTKAVGIAMTATDTSMFEPDDAGALNVVGCDTNVPQVVGDFIRSGFGG